MRESEPEHYTKLEWIECSFRPWSSSSSSSSSLAPRWQARSQNAAAPWRAVEEERGEGEEANCVFAASFDRNSREDGASVLHHALARSFFFLSFFLGFPLLLFLLLLLKRHSDRRRQPPLSLISRASLDRPSPTAARLSERRQEAKQAFRQALIQPFCRSFKARLCYRRRCLR